MHSFCFCLRAHIVARLQIQVGETKMILLEKKKLYGTIHMYFSSNKCRGSFYVGVQNVWTRHQTCCLFWGCYLTLCFVFTLFSISGIAGHDQFVPKTKNNFSFQRTYRKLLVMLGCGNSQVCLHSKDV